MKKLLVVLLAAWPLLAQRQEVIHVQNQAAQRIHEILAPMIPEGTRMKSDDQLKAITVSGPPEVVDLLKKNIALLDVPRMPPPASTSRSVEVTVHLVAGAESDSKIPPDLDGVVKQLRGVFPFKGYQVLDTTVLRAREFGGTSTSVELSGAAAEMPATTYFIEFKQVSADGEPRRITIAPFRFRARYPYVTGSFQATNVSSVSKQFQFAEAHLETDISIREGQKAVVGKSSLGPGKESLFVVVSAKVVD